MENLQQLQQQIERLRRELHLLVSAKQENFVDEEVTALSAELDRLIVQYERARSMK